ncbi:uncharacterized protein LOC111244779 isoform X2 [Varroa destructor]|uniref:Uncharacterized protein n=1 Tax=Varroa destructor TaxID=109461 RepID=A0A7M7J7G8_VARDE|nr:uncharacterized protein LOC111244779 isoform X2 [Varroa destructor]
MNADQIFDDALNNVKNTTRIRMRLDPLRLDDMVTQKIVVHDITIRNLLSLERQGPALISSSRQNLTMDAGLAFRNVVVEAKFRLKREPRVLRIRGSVSAILERLVAKIRLYANILAGTVALVYFEVTELGHLRVTNLTGAGALNKLARTLTQRFLIDRNLEKIRQVIQKRGREAIEQTLRGTNLSSLL